MSASLSRRMTAEFLGTGLLVAAVVGSGIMAGRLAGGNAAIALLANTIATGAALIALILALGPISGAHLNPVVTLADAIDGALARNEAAGYVAAQVFGGLAGTIAANAMFGLPMIEVSHRVRTGPEQWFSELVATFGLILVIRGCSKSTKGAVAFGVGAYITSAYWFTASTSFANPAVTIARALSDTFAGIRPADVPEFVVAQFAGGIGAAMLLRWLAAEVTEAVKDARHS